MQVSAGPNLDGAERTRDQLLKAGFDSFLYEVDGGYRIMCGKFQSKYNAKLYRELIQEKTEREDAYVTDVTLPEAAMEDFVECYQEGSLGGQGRVQRLGDAHRQVRGHDRQ